MPQKQMTQPTRTSVIHFGRTMPNSDQRSLVNAMITSRGIETCSALDDPVQHVD